MPNVIKQIVKEGQYGTQSVRMFVKSNERGPKGDQGEPGATASIEAGNAYSIPTDQPAAVINTGTASEAVFDFYIPKGETGAQGPAGKDGAIQYVAGSGIKIKGNVISATGGGGGGGEWGDITGDITNQTDLMNEFSKYTPTSSLATVATTGSYSDLLDKPSIPDVKQGLGTSTTDVVSQAGVTYAFYGNDYPNRHNIGIGGGITNTGTRCVAIGDNASASTEGSMALGEYSQAYDNPYAMAIGSRTWAGGRNSIALGRGAWAQYQGEINVGINQWDTEAGKGYNNTNFRLISGVHDPANANDAATKGYVDNLTPVITMQTTDPGEGVALQANHFIAVYNAS